jgi:hypothetical protein
MFLALSDVVEATLIGTLGGAAVGGVLALTSALWVERSSARRSDRASAEARAAARRSGLEDRWDRISAAYTEFHFATELATALAKTHPLADLSDDFEPRRQAAVARLFAKRTELTVELSTLELDPSGAVVDAAVRLKSSVLSHLESAVGLVPENAEKIDATLLELVAAHMVLREAIRAELTLSATT